MPNYTNYTFEDEAKRSEWTGATLTETTDSFIHLRFTREELEEMATGLSEAAYKAMSWMDRQTWRALSNKIRTALAEVAE